MKIPYANLHAEYIECKTEIDLAIQTCITNNNFINGTAVDEFEKKWSEFTKNEDSAGTSSGTSALFLSLVSLNIKSGDEVIVPSMSFMSTSEVVNQVGATPVFVDIDEFYTIDIEKIAEKITEKTKAIIFVDLYGQTIDIEKLKSIVGNIPLIRDAAQSAGCINLKTDINKYVYSTCFSFYPGKNLSAMGDAGAVCGSKELCNKIRYYRDHARTEKYVHTGIGYNERLDAIQAAIISAKLQYLEKWNSLRDANANYYIKNLKNLRIVLPKVNPVSNHVWNQFVIRSKARNTLKKYLHECGIETGLQFPIPLHKQPVYNQKISLPNSESLAEECLSLPVFAHLKQEEIDYIIDCIWNYDNL